MLPHYSLLRLHLINASNYIYSSTWIDKGKIAGGGGNTTIHFGHHTLRAPAKFNITSAAHKWTGIWTELFDSPNKFHLF